MKKKLKIKKVPKDDLKKVKGGRDLSAMNRDVALEEVKANSDKGSSFKIQIMKKL